MIIPIQDDWRLRSDRLQWIVEQRFTPKKGSKTTEPYWVAHGYYSTIESATRGLFELRLRLSDAEGMAEAVSEAKRLSEELSNALQPYVKLVA